MRSLYYVQRDTENSRPVMSTTVQVQPNQTRDLAADTRTRDGPSSGDVRTRESAVHGVYISI
jgi:hypothetical protein